ncbi:MAG: AAA family ATPase [Desulfobacteraceae bacterium]|nr:MAG: AAA family ATPase [Desulfobacteraceae bacterium]
MYLSHYELKAKPFEMTTDPAFLWVGEKHQQVLSAMTYAIFKNKGLLVLTGDVGTGKTTLIKALVSKLGDDVASARISNPGLDILEFFSFIAIAFQMDRAHYRSKGEFLIDLEEFLQTTRARNKKALLIIDEAHNLSFELLEEIRLLSNMESADEKMINILLVGQMGLNEKLNDPRCRILRQLTQNRLQIGPLDLEDTREYLATRLKIAGAKKGKDIFSTGAIEAIYQYSEGYPRMINRLADSALLLGYSKGEKEITSHLVSQCHEDMDPKAALPASIQRRTDPDDIKRTKRVYGVHQWKWASVLISALIIVGVGMSWYLYTASKVSDQASLDRATKDQVLVAKKMPQETEDIGSEKIIEQETPFDVETAQIEAEPSTEEVPVSPPEVPPEEPEALPPLVAKAPEPELFNEIASKKEEPPVFIEPSTETVVTTEERVEPKVKGETIEPESSKVAAIKTTPEQEPAAQEAIPKPIQSQELTIAQVQEKAPRLAKKTVAPEKSAATTQSPPKVSPLPAESQAPPQSVESSDDRVVSDVSKEKSRPAIQTREISESASLEFMAPAEEKISSDVDKKVAVKSPEVPELEASIRTDIDYGDLQNRLEAFLALYCQTYQDKKLDKFATFFTTDATEKGKLFSSLMPKYRRNFELLDSLNYRIELQRHSIHEKTGNIHIEGVFRAQARLKGGGDKWRYSFGDITMELVSVGDFFKVRRLDYKIR